MFSKNSKASDSAVETGTTRKPAPPSIISADMRMVGDLSSEGEIQVDGAIDGDIRCKNLLVGETAIIKGEIVADSVRVHGTIDGQIRARNVNLANTARVTGDIHHKKLSIDEGAYLEGLCRRIDDKKEADGKINLVVKEGGDAKASADGTPSTPPSGSTPNPNSGNSGSGQKVAAGS